MLQLWRTPRPRWEEPSVFPMCRHTLYGHMSLVGAGAHLSGGHVEQGVPMDIHMEGKDDGSAQEAVQARNMTTRVRRPLKGTLRKKIRSYATPSKKVKKTRKPNCFLHSCARKKLNQSRKSGARLRFPDTFLSSDILESNNSTIKDLQYELAQARNMTMRVRRPLKGTLRKKIRSHATPSKKVKNTREPNCFLRSCAREKLNQAEKGTKYDHEGQKTSKRNLEKENPIARHSVEEGTKYDHEGQKTSKRNLEKENPIARHSVEEGEEHKRTKLFLRSCAREKLNQAEKGTKYDHEGQKTSKRNLEKENPIARHSVEEGEEHKRTKLFLRSCAREKLNQAEKGTKYDHEGQKTSKRNLEKENPIVRHSVEEGTKYDHEGQKTSKRNLEKENPIARHSVEEGEENKRTKLFSPFLCTCETEPKPKEKEGQKGPWKFTMGILEVQKKAGLRNLILELKARNMTMRVRRPLKGTLRKKIRSHATPSKKVKNTREPNCFLRSCAREKLNQAEKGTKYDHEGQKTSKRNLEKENPIARHSVEEGTKYDHEGQKTSKRNLEKENPIARHSVEEGTKYDHEGQKTSKRNLEKENPIARHSVEEGTKYDHEGQKTSKRNLEKENPIVRHSVEEGEENKRTKLFSPFPCTRETEPKPKEVPKYESESTKGAESKEKISSATPE
ncbi:hypothetical protein MJG53_019933 [Ovis ammon polii x Ovis aries]|uniref:Uncharacterized protein n=1 Tax=Ovis ammon polii x Ovis aries TaxID=2918886 RepID=A0ACB9U1S4_9CETA|nr:hypothetical protein MJG53_019933 [Ovis ammon polii x Ovis aries]